MLVRICGQPYLLSIAFFLKERDNCSSLFDLIQGFFQELTPLAEGGAILQSDEEEMGKLRYLHF